MEEGGGGAGRRARTVGSLVVNLEALAALLRDRTRRSLAEAERAEAVGRGASCARSWREPLSEEAATEAAASRLEAKSTTLLRCLDCEATYPEFVEAVASVLTSPHR